MTVRVGLHKFDRVCYDTDGDAHYLRRGPAQQAATDTCGIAITLVNAKWLMEHDGGLRVTVPSLLEAGSGDLARAIARD